MHSIDTTNFKGLEKVTLQLLQISRSLAQGVRRDEQLILEAHLQQLEEQFRFAAATRDTRKMLATAREISALGRELLGYLGLGKNRDPARQVGS